MLKNLTEVSDSAVTIRGYHPTYWPTPGCILEGVEFRHGARQLKLITIEKLTIEGSYSGILIRHTPRITAQHARVSIPPFGSHEEFHTLHSNLVVDEIVANGSTVEFQSNDPHRDPVIFLVHDAHLHDVRWGNPIRYQLKFRNPEPPAEVSVSGSFGAWATGHAEDTPLSGQYTLTEMELGEYGGIGGLLTSSGQFNGPLKHIGVTGTTDTPDFEVKSGGRKVKLTSKFDAYVDARHGDTYLNRVEAQFRRTTVIAEGSIAGSESHHGKEAELHLAVRNGRLEDVLGLFVSAPRSPMSGALLLNSRAEIPSGDQPFLNRVKLTGTFGVDEGSFSKPDTQKNVDELSAGARGLNKEDPETVLTDLKGRVELVEGLAQFSDLGFSMPGADARMQGRYNILNHRIDLHGEMRVDTKISKTTSGAKALLLKVMDPFFKKKKEGEIVPIHIGGTYEKPEFGLDLLKPAEMKQPAK